MKQTEWHDEAVRWIETAKLDQGPCQCKTCKEERERMSKTNERTVAVMVRITPKGDRNIRERMGIWSKAEYVREALKLAVEHDLRGPTERDM